MSAWKMNIIINYVTEEEKDYLDYDIVDYDYNITFEKNPNIESDD